MVLGEYLILIGCQLNPDAQSPYCMTTQVVTVTGKLTNSEYFGKYRSVSLIKMDFLFIPLHIWVNGGPD